MLNFLASYGGTILIGLLVLTVVVLIVLGMFRGRKKGHSSCGGNCGQCASCGCLLYTSRCV